MLKLVGELTDLNIKFKLELAAGVVCQAIYPISVSSFKGTGTEVGICTLSSMDLLKKISRSPLMDKLLIVGRLFSENKRHRSSYSVLYDVLDYEICDFMWEGY